MKKKLIEVALPLEAINLASSHEKSVPRKGHPATLHLWWARRPLAACRAVLFASLVDDPSSNPEQFPTEADQDNERQRLFHLLEKLVKWENSGNQTILKAAHEEILKSTGGNPPPVYDPFCGGGSIPLEAQRLGLQAYGSDLNPVAVLITKALIEIPPRFAGQPPINSLAKKKIGAKGLWTGALGLAEDVRHYGEWVRDKAAEQLQKYYPRIPVTIGSTTDTAGVIAWLWARTIQCPNPACGARMPMARTFWLSTKTGKKAWVEPLVDHASKSVKFLVRTGEGGPPEGTKQRGRSVCIFCSNILSDSAVRREASLHGLNPVPLAVVAEGPRGRLYISAGDVVVPDIPHVDAAFLNHSLPSNARWFSPPGYGMHTYRDLFTGRQLLSLDTLSDYIGQARQQAVKDGASSEYADAIVTYLSFALDKLTDWSSSICSWITRIEGIRDTFARQAIPMVWDFAEINPFSNSVGNFMNHVTWVAETVGCLGLNTKQGYSVQLDATSGTFDRKDLLICTDPPYYDNIGYADLSDFFYVWLRHNLASSFPDLFSTLLVPKTQELVATPYRFEGSEERARQFFEEGFRKTFLSLCERQNRSYPLTVFYAFKQSETDEEDEDTKGPSVASTGWETMLQGLMDAELQVTGTWPIRSERAGRSISIGTNALASSIVLVCRPRPKTAGITTRKDFLVMLKKELPQALRNLQKGNIAPVDLAQAAIGPGMSVFSRYKKVLESDGSSMRVRTALGLINQGLDEVLSELESEFDPDTRWALVWFEQHQFEEGPYGEAEVLATAKALSIVHLSKVGIVYSAANKVRLLRREELPEVWDPSVVVRLTVWAVTQHLIRSLDRRGESETANLKAKLGGMAEIARDLAYRLYVLCERKGWAEEAGYYNSLVVAWPSMTSEVFELS